MHSKIFSTVTPYMVSLPFVDFTLESRYLCGLMIFRLGLSDKLTSLSVEDRLSS